MRLGDLAWRGLAARPLRSALTAAGVALQFVLWGIVLAQTVLARGAARDALALPVDTLPALGFEEFIEDAPSEGAPAG